jgi:hypothetical protein
MMKLKREWAYNIAIKGFSYNTAKGEYPTKATLADATSWTKTVSDNKDLPAVVFKVQAVA